jgi:hypothetical protein
LGSLRRTLLLYLGFYALDFGTSALFIVNGYGFVETNVFQRALVASPGLDTLLPWILNQNIWIILGAAGVFAYFGRRELARKLHLDLLLTLCSFIRLYALSTNVAFVLQLVFGLSLAPLGYYTILCVPVLVALWRGLRDHTWQVHSMLTGMVGKAEVGPF